MALSFAFLGLGYTAQIMVYPLSSHAHSAGLTRLQG